MSAGLEEQPFRIERREGWYVQPAHGVGHGHRRAKEFLQVRYHVVGVDGKCVPELCGAPGQRVCGWIRRYNARAALLSLRKEKSP